MNNSDQYASPYSVMPNSRREWGALLAVIAGLMALRAPFINTWQPIGDSANYALGALRTHVAHPPGSIGYCLLVGWVDQIVGQVFVAMLIISLIGTVLGIGTCHLLGKAVGLRWPAALLVAAVYGASMNTLMASLLCLPHILEGMFAAMFLLLAIMAIRRGSGWIALAAGIILAIAGSSRPTTTFFLFPAWLYLLWAVRPREWVVMGIHIVLFFAIVGAWKIANDHYMTNAGYGGVTFDLQAMMPSDYEYASFSSTPKRFAHTQPTYHMPWWEVASWMDRRAGLDWLPHKANWPEPSLKRAATLVLMQTCKFSYFLVISAPVFAIAGLGWLFGMLGARARGWPEAKITGLLALSLAGPIGLFIFGHMGAVDYLQLILPATSVIAVYMLMPPSQRIGISGEVSTMNWSALSRAQQFFAAAALGVGTMGMLYFVMGRPWPGNGRVSRTMNTVLNEFTGYAIKHSVNIANRNSALQVTATPFAAVRSDEGFLRVVDEIDFSPVPDSLRSTPRRVNQDHGSNTP